MPMPTEAAAFCSPSPPSLGASEANAVLHDLAKSTRNGTVPSSKLLALLNVRPSTVNVLGQSTGVSRSTAPASSRPERGDHLERRAGRHRRGEGEVELAAVRPVGHGEDGAVADPDGDQRRPLRLAGQRGVGRVLDPLVQRGLQRLPGLGLGWNSSTRPRPCRRRVAAAGSRPARPGVPRSRSSYCSCSPDWPTWSPTTYLPGLASICSLGTSPTVPSSARAKARVGASCRVVLLEHGARQVADLGADLVVHLPPQGDDLDERVRLGGRRSGPAGRRGRPRRRRT